MVLHFLKIRLVRLWREVIALGWWRTLLVALLLVLTGLFIYKQMGLYPNCLYATGLVSLLVGVIHINRKDKMFILITGVHPLKLYMAEYVLFSMPVFILMCFTPHW